MSCANPQNSDATRNTTSAREEDEPRADEVGELAEHGEQDGAGERVGDEHPAHLLDRAELAGDRGERGRDHGVVERTEERDGEQGDHRGDGVSREKEAYVIYPNDRVVDATGCGPVRHHTRERIRRIPTSCPF